MPDDQRDVTTGFDHFDPEVASDPHRIYADLRARCPVAHSEAHGGFWLVTRYADLRRVAEDWETFSSENPIIARAEGEVEAPADGQRLDATFLTMDPPDHDKFRRPVQPWFAPRVVWALEPRIRRSAAQLVDGFAGTGGCELVADYARPLTTSTIAQHFGLSQDEMDRFASHAYASMSLDDGEAAAGGLATTELLTELMAARRKAPRHDVLSALLDMEVYGRPLTEDEARRAAFVLLFAGFETTMNAIATSLWYLAEHPEDRARLVDQGSELAPEAVDEFLRLLAPLASARTARRDAVVGGQEIRKGDRLLLAFQSGNRDAAEFDSPDELVADRAGNRHIAFGSGVHRCIGRHLARLELRVALEEMLRRVPAFEIDPTQSVEWSFGKTQAWGASRLPVVFPART